MNGRRVCFNGTTLIEMRRIPVFIFVFCNFVFSFFILIPRAFWWQEALRCLWLYCIIGNLLSFLLLLLLRKKTQIFYPMFFIFICFLGAFAIQVWDYFPRFELAKTVNENKYPISVFFIAGNEIVSPLQEKVDVLIYLSDINPLQDQRLSTLKFPFKASTVVDGAANFSVLSRFPILEKPLISLGDDFPPAILVKLQMENGCVLNVGAMQLFAPISKEAVSRDDIIVRRMGMKLRFLKEPTVVAASMRMSPFTRVHGVFEYLSRMTNAGKGHGMPLALDKVFALPFFPSKHFFVKELLEIEQVRGEKDGIFMKVAVAAHSVLELSKEAKANLNVFGKPVKKQGFLCKFVKLPTQKSYFLHSLH
ncbi:MAG: hypothetical protein GYA55_02775 [SAR324 cluster bacterium]|uniref:Uncharacterized protein n=1 Tax=SAR324 cluster bacterium TaxID=2024889 RepID=A0A7X9IJH6_9DELT|nr:hypothetical protein [SAR324 cluster bacterium]